MKAEVCNGSDGPDFPVLSFQFIQLNWEEQDLLKKQQDAAFGCQHANLNEAPTGLFHCMKTEWNMSESITHSGVNFVCEILIWVV